VNSVAQLPRSLRKHRTHFYDHFAIQPRFADAAGAKISTLGRLIISQN